VTERYVKISAEIELISYMPSSTNASRSDTRRKYLVDCVVGTNEWWIDSHFNNTANETYFFDGTNVYEAIQLIRPISPELLSKPGMPATVPFEQAKSNVMVTIVPSPGGHPLGNLGVNIPWLAFCSGHYLKLKGRVVPVPTVVAVKETADAFGYTDNTLTFDDDLGLPKQIELLTSKARLKSSLDDERLVRVEPVQRVRMTGGPKRPDGLLRFRYQTDESTNFNGWNFPITFSYTDFRPDSQGSWKAYVGGIGRLIGLTESSKPDNVLKSGTNVHIVDYRFRDKTKLVDGIIYSSLSSTGILSVQDPVLQSKFLSRMKKAPTDPTLLVPRLRWTLLVLALLAIFVPLMFVRAKKIKPSRKSKEKL
jgi:hypothetical protein